MPAKRIFCKQDPEQIQLLTNLDKLPQAGVGVLVALWKAKNNPRFSARGLVILP